MAAAGDQGRGCKTAAPFCVFTVVAAMPPLFSIPTPLSNDDLGVGENHIYMLFLIFLFSFKKFRLSNLHVLEREKESNDLPKGRERECDQRECVCTRTPRVCGIDTTS